jgi:outer membrane cobalamin receptor/copper chaperone CopZ
MLTITTEEEGYDENQVHLAVTRVGHDTRKYLAPQKIYDQLHACCKYRDAEVIAAHQPSNTKNQIWVDGICGMCKDRIEKAVIELEGIKMAEWDVESRMLTYTSDDEAFDEDQIHLAVTRVGHDTKKYLAPQKAYDALHACCKYRDPDVVADHQPSPSPATSVTGRILVEDNGETVPLPGVNIYWLDETTGTVTDMEGKFALERPEQDKPLVASYVGFYTDTLLLEGKNTVELTLTPGNTLETVEVTYERKSIEVSFVNPIMVQQINSKELLKAACCTLAESFETNPTVDVSFSDAVTGARQIEMLGLAGPYVQITRESLPDVRGLAAIYGLVYLPGPWVEGIQLAKGTGSVVNGFESITGQINVELKKPDEGDRFYLNLYGNEGSRMEANANARFQVNDKWHTGLLVHGNWQNSENDRNEDGFVDMPVGTNITAINRWKYRDDNGWNGQFGIKGTYLDKTSGQLGFDQENPSSSLWGAIMNTTRMEGWAKLGKVFVDRPDASIGLQLSAISHNQEALFGNTIFDADQKTFYANLIYRETLGGPEHGLTSGVSFQWDRYDETVGEGMYERDEMVPGVFTEYTYQPNENFTAVAGLRGDHHNQFGLFFTPRLHLRYAVSEKTVFRASAGQGRRTASIFAENIGMLASSRSIIVENNNDDTPYGLNQEKAWNFGLNARQTFIIADRELIITLDGYHTRFDQQIVVDYDQSPREVRFYNLEGNSTSNNFQAQMDYALIKNFDVRIAYRFSDVNTEYAQGELERPFVANHRAFINLGYSTEKGWAYDLTVNWQGSKRIPSTADNPSEFRVADRSPDFVLVNGQISKSWQEKFDLYLGVENLFNFQQDNPILGAEDPFGPYFDSSLIWGPIFGRMVYGGVRYRVFE